MKKEKLIILTTFSTLLISLFRGHGVLNIQMITIMSFINPKEYFEWKIIAVFFTIGQINIIYSIFNKKRKRTILSLGVGLILISFIMGFNSLDSFKPFSILSILPFLYFYYKSLKIQNRNHN